jgi:acetoin utilization deacetylase AcuC-like enzyme
MELDHLEEKVRAADVHLNRLKRMAGQYPSATWDNEMLNLDAEKTLRALLVFIESLQHFNSDTVYPINGQMLDQIQLAAAGLVELIHHFMATHRQAEKPIPVEP